MLSYSFHISSKNHSINTSADLKRVSNHNTRKFEEVKENNLEMNLELSQYNTTLIGTDNLYQDVKNFYINFFEESRLEFNQKQKRDDRKIYDYFEKISNDSKKQMAVEVIVQLGDKKFWENKTIEEKLQMTEVYKEQLLFLEKKLENFKICNAIIHYDEASPHIQLVGVPITENCKQGMSKQVSKKSVFTKEVLKELQLEMRENAIENFNKFYKTKEVLKPLEKGRNKDYLIEEIKEIRELEKEKELRQKEIEKLKETIQEKRNENKELFNKYNDLKDLLKKNKVALTNYEDRCKNLERTLIETKEKNKYLEKDIENEENNINLKQLELNKIKEQNQKIEEQIELARKNIITKPNENDLKKVTDFRKKLENLESYFPFVEYTGVQKFLYSNKVNFKEEDIKKIRDFLNSLNTEIITSEKIIEQNLEQKEKIEKYEKIMDTQDNNLLIKDTQIYELSKKVNQFSKENEKNNKIKDLLFEEFPKIKELWDTVDKNLYPVKEKSNIWKKKIEKDRGMER